MRCVLSRPFSVRNRILGWNSYWEQKCAFSVSVHPPVDLGSLPAWTQGCCDRGFPHLFSRHLGDLARSGAIRVIAAKSIPSATASVYRDADFDLFGSGFGGGGAPTGGGQLAGE